MATTIASGYNPVPGPDGLLAYGGAHETFLWDGLSTRPISAGSCAGWNGREVVVSRGVEFAPRVYGRRLVFVNVDTGAERDSGIDPAQEPGNFPTIAHINGVTVSSVEGQHFVNGQPIATEPGAGKIEDFDGEHILYPVQIDGQYTFVVKRLADGADIHRVNWKLENARLDRLASGPWLSWNNYGTMGVLAPSGVQFNSPAGEGRGLMAEWNGLIVAITVRQEGWTPVWIIRKFWDQGALYAWNADAPGWIVRGVGWDGMKFVDGIAYGYLQGAGGELGIQAIDFDAPREVYVPPAPPVANLPDWPEDFPPILVGCLAHAPQPSDPGTLGNVGTDKPVIIEGYRQADGARWTVTEEDRRRQRLIYIDWKESHAKEAMLANAKADQDAYGGTLVFYFDSNEMAQELETTIQYASVVAGGRAAIRALRCYPSGQTPEEMYDRVKADLVRCDWAILVTSGYQQAWSAETARIAMRLTARLAAEHPGKVKAVVITKRPPYLPEIQEDIAALCALAPVADVDALFPKWKRDIAPPPVDEPDEVVPPKLPWWKRPVTTTKPKRSFFGWLKKAFGL